VRQRAAIACRPSPGDVLRTGWPTKASAIRAPAGSRAISPATSPPARSERADLTLAAELRREGR